MVEFVTRSLAAPVKIVGRAVRVSLSTLETLGGFFQESMPILQQADIEDKVSDNLYVLFTDFEGDYDHPYTMVVGVAVGQISQLPQGFKMFEIPAQTYEVHRLESALPEFIARDWQAITDDEALSYRRSYKTDAHVYHPDGSLEMFVGVMD